MELRRSLLSLISFCAAAVLATALGLVMLFASTTVLLAIGHRSHDADPDVVNAATGTQDDAKGNAIDSANGFVFSGVITDDHCGTRHDMGSNLSPAECARACVHDGGHYVIVSGDKRYSLAGRNDLIMLAGERVTVTGTLTGDTVMVKSITTEK